MTTQVGKILTIWGNTTPRYDVFTLESMASNQSWNYDDAAVVAGHFVPGIAYTIATVGTTDFTLIGADANTVGHTFVATGYPAYGDYNNGVGSGTGTATVAGITRVAQPLPASGQVSFNYTPSTAPIGGQPQTQGSPNVTLEFVVEVLYLTGTGPDLTQTVEHFRQLALTEVNTAFGLALA